ncbi:MAG: hypothetical protein AAFO81_01125 [Pseudomonadota bacterium]
MHDEITQTIRLKRRSKVDTNVVGGTVWNEPVEDTELELVSTRMLEVMIDEDEAMMRRQLQRLEHADDGVLAHNPANKTLEIVPRDDVRTALATNGATPAAADRLATQPSQNDPTSVELSLVSTAMVKVMIEKPELSPKEVEFELELLEDAAGGFDPYNSA